MSLTGTAAIQMVLSQARERDPSIVLLGEVVGPGVQVLPISDRATVALATGMARGGKRPVVELADASRLLAVVEALHSAAGTGDPTPMVVRVPCHEPGAASLSAAPWSALAQIPGLSVAVAADPSAAAGLLRSALAAPGPVVLVEPRTVYVERADIGDAPQPLASARVLRQGTHVVLAAWGAGVSAAQSAAESLAAEGVEASVVDLVSASPLDTTTLGASVRAAGRLVVADGCGPTLLALQAGTQAGFEYLESPPLTAQPTTEALVAAAWRSLRF